MKKMKHIAAGMLSVLALLLMLPMQALAAGSIDVNRDESLTISFQDGAAALTGVQFDLYLTATVDEYGELTTTDEFAQFQVNIRGENDEAWRTLASTLEGYVLREKLTPADSGATDDQGLAVFPTEGKQLRAGLYLVLGHQISVNSRRYDPAPFMVMLPGLDRENNSWNYDVTVNAKYDTTPIPDENTIDLKVIKVWEDQGHEKDRPKEVVVQLLCDGEVYDTVTLNAENSWRHIWTELEEGCSWTVVEQEVDGYTVVVTQEGNTFIVTNTCVQTSPQPSPSTTPGIPGTPSIPQTGQLWWPVPLLAAVGLLLVVLGLIRRRGCR
ncbi:MAG: Cna B-type domain-containing protein [Oscillospiraceae bacterium]|nr:Cna B-type domain-containing protein [Oscillospiraceae bacterium]